MRFNKSIYNFFVVVLRIFMKIFFPYEVSGQENIEDLESGCIICCNHLSVFDPIFLMISCPNDIFFMAKQELFENKFIGHILSLLGVFPVNRGKGDSSAINHAVNLVKSKKNLGIFIEGTRSKTGEFLRPKSGASVVALQTNANILPVCITGSASKNKIKIFKKTYINYGQIIKFSDIDLSDYEAKKHKIIRDLTQKIMNDIQNLRFEKGRIK